MGVPASQKFMKYISRFVASKPVIALKDGMLAILPLTVVGSLFLIIGNLPFAGLNAWLTSILGDGWAAPFGQVYAGTFAIMGMISCFSIAYSYAKNSGLEGLPAGVLALASFFITLRDGFMSVDGEIIPNAVEKVWLGGQGMIAAIIIGLSVGAIYSAFIKNKWTIKMPEQVPEAISRQFEAMIPAFVVFVVSMIVFIISKSLTDGGTFVELIYNMIQIPLQGLSDSWWGAIGIAFFISFLWWFGVHGQSVVNGIVTALLLSNLNANQALQAAGELTTETGSIVTQQFLDSFLVISGSGITFGVVICMLFFAKSEQYKALGKVSALPAIFNVNEPVIFGFPVVLNPIMFVPFVAVPVAAAAVVYLSIATGFMAPFSGVTLPWSMPAIISGLIVAGWKGALVQIIILIISVAIYYPFFKMQDKQAYEREQAQNQA